jgi:predicted rRNA methylase YqxC with S4 and FtsJ domains
MVRTFEKDGLERFTASVLDIGCSTGGVLNVLNVF